MEHFAVILDKSEVDGFVSEFKANFCEDPDAGGAAEGRLVRVITDSTGMCVLLAVPPNKAQLMPRMCAMLGVSCYRK